MTARIVETGRPSSPRKEPSGTDLPEARMLGEEPHPVKAPVTRQTATRYRLVLSCSYDEEAPFPKSE